MKKLFLLPVLALFPVVASAAEFVDSEGLGEVRSGIIDVINNFIIPILFAVAFVVFIWGVFQYLILGAGNSEKRQEGIKLVLWGIIGFFVMVSVWGMVNLVVGAFNFGGASLEETPKVQFTGTAN